VSFPYDTPFSNNNKVDLDTYPAVAVVNKVLAPEFNAVVTAINALATALTEGNYHGLVSTPGAAVSPPSGVRIRNNGGALEVSLNGAAYSSVLNSSHVDADHMVFQGPLTVTGSETLVVTQLSDNFVPLTGTGPVTLTATPLLGTGVNNPTRVTIFNESVTGGVTVPHGGSSGCFLRDSLAVELLVGSSITLYYVTNTVPDTGTWYEVGRSLVGV
jgi:hypothetical protein